MGNYPSSEINTHSSASTDSGQKAAQLLTKSNPKYQQQPDPLKPRPPVTTAALVGNIEIKIAKWQAIINNIKEDNKFDITTRMYLQQLMDEAEKELHDINCTMAKEVPKPNERRIQKKPGNRSASFRKSLDKLNEEAGQLLKSMDEQTKELNGANKSIEKLEKGLLDSKERCTLLQKEKDELALRFSKIAGDKMAINNPSIADLSDPNRPTKLGEAYSEVYDNEWSDAFEGLQKGGYGDEDIIKTLRITLHDAMEFCKEKSITLLSQSEDVITNLFDDHLKTLVKKGESKVSSKSMAVRQVKSPDMEKEETHIEKLHLRAKLYSRWKPSSKAAPYSGADKTASSEKTKMMNSQDNYFEEKFIKLRKDVAFSLVPMVHKAYLKNMWDASCIQSMKPYIRKCITICWLMVVQTPPMTLVDSDVTHPGFKTDHLKDLYRPYVTSGPVVKYVVWPAMRLHDGGPLVLKGVAEFQK